MNREEAIERLNGLRARCERMSRSVTKTGYDEWIKDIEGIGLALSALGGPTREQVEKAWRGEWQMVSNGSGVCSECHRQDKIDPLAKFCRYCGAPLTDEAVEMVLERIHSMLEV